VKLVIDPNTNRKYAMKIPKSSEEGLTEEDQEFIRNEIHIITKLTNHSNIVRVVDYIPSGSIIYPNGKSKPV
jgi:serine/threonine protein kinase